MAEPGTGASGFAAAFARGLLDPGAAKPAGVIGPHGKGAQTRYNVYRNNVTASLTEAMAEIFPAVLRLTGVTFFDAMAREYVRAHPPSSPLLFEYGHGFADFVAAFPPAAGLPYLADVARLERAWLTAYHAEDRAPLDPALLAAITPGSVGAVRFAMHPAFAVIASRFPLYMIFQMNRDKARLEPVDMTISAPALVTRPGADVLVASITPADAVFLARIGDGATLAAAAGAALQQDATFDLNGALTTLLYTGAACGLRQQQTDRGENHDTVDNR